MTGMINGNGFIPNDGLNGSVAPWVSPTTGGLASYPAGSPGNTVWGMNSSDGVRPAWYGGSDASDPSSALGSLFGSSYGSSSSTYSAGGLSAILSQLANAVQQYIGKLGNSLLGTSSTTGSSGSSGTSGSWSGSPTSFQNVSLGSVGDPHLSVSGTAENADGTTSNVNSHFDSMTGHDDLFSTRDFGDGFHVSTTVTQPAANGVTLNASASAVMDGGLDSVTMTNGGTVTVTSGGSSIALSAGQNVQLENGATVTEAANGSVSIAEQRYGESLTTTFAQNGSDGVDVTATGSNVTLGGDLVNGGTTRAQRAQR